MIHPGVPLHLHRLIKRDKPQGSVLFAPKLVSTKRVLNDENTFLLRAPNVSGNAGRTPFHFIYCVCDCAIAVGFLVPWGTVAQWSVARNPLRASVVARPCSAFEGA